MSRTVLLIDDEQYIRETLGNALKDRGFRVETASGGTPGMQKMREQRFDVVMLDIWMPDMDGLEVLQRIRSEFPEQVVVMMSGHGTIETAVRATKLGAFDFIEKPLSLERILPLLQSISTMLDQSSRRTIQPSRALIGESAAISQIRDLIKRVAPTTGSVLITGENGTGKELVAHSIHALSPRLAKPFVEVNCAAIPEELIESELFGHEKGAFTGATQMKRGKFDLANGGTLFLDEIGDMSLKTQAKILRILQEQRFERVGGSQTIQVDVRVVAATNKDLKTEITKGSFREDLFYRLNVIPFHVPALRDRRADIPLLANHFLREFVTTHGRKPRELSSGAMKMLQASNWPGNVRELKNLMERVVILSPESEDGTPITEAHLVGHLSGAVAEATTVESQSASALRTLKEARQGFERDLILKALDESDGNVSKAALALGIERSHLHRKMKSFGIDL